MVQNMVRLQYPEVFSEEQLKKLNRLHYSGWGNFCAKFLTEIEGIHKDTGQQFTIPAGSLGNKLQFDAAAK